MLLHVDIALSHLSGTSSLFPQHLFNPLKKKSTIESSENRIFGNQEPGRGSQYVHLGITSCIIIVNMHLYLHETVELDAVLFGLHCALEKCTGRLKLF